MADEPANRPRSLRCSLSWSSYRELSPTRDQPKSIEQEQPVALTCKDALRASHNGDKVSSRTILNDTHPAYRHNTRIAEDPKSFSDADFFARHESLRRKRSSQQFNQNAKEPFVARYRKYSSAPIDEVIVCAQRTAPSPIDFAKPQKVPEKYHETREAPDTPSTNELRQGGGDKPKTAACYWLHRAVSSVRELRVAKSSSQTGVRDDRETAVASTVTGQVRSDPLSANIPISSVVNNLAQRFKDIQLRHAPSSGTLSSLGPLPDPLPADIVTAALQGQKPVELSSTSAQKHNKEAVDEEYENEKVALFFTLNIGREQKDANRKAADRKRLEQVAHILDLLKNEPDSCRTQEYRLQSEKAELEKCLAKRMEKLKYDKDLDADAKIAADGQDLRCRRYAGNAAISKPTNGIPHTLNSVYPVTDVSFIQRTGHIQLIGPAKYGGLATGILWIEGAHYEHPRVHASWSSSTAGGCVCKNHQCFEAVTDDNYKYIGMARTKKEKKWVIHLAKEKPNIGRWHITRKPIVEINNTTLEPVFEIEPEPQPETISRPPSRPAPPRPLPPARLLSGKRFYDEADSSISSSGLA